MGLGAKNEKYCPSTKGLCGQHSSVESRGFGPDTRAPRAPQTLSSAMACDAKQMHAGALSFIFTHPPEDCKKNKKNKTKNKKTNKQKNVRRSYSRSWSPKLETSYFLLCSGPRRYTGTVTTATPQNEKNAVSLQAPPFHRLRHLASTIENRPGTLCFLRTGVPSVTLTSAGKSAMKSLFHRRSKQSGVAVHCQTFVCRSWATPLTLLPPTSPPDTSTTTTCLTLLPRTSPPDTTTITTPLTLLPQTPPPPPEHHRNTSNNTTTTATAKHTRA